MESFNDIPERTNNGGPSNIVLADWWNILKRAGKRLENIFGSGLVEETQFTIADNQSTYANITSMLVSSATLVYAEIRYTIYRTDAASIKRRESGVLELEYVTGDSAWRIANRQSSDDALNVTDSLAVTAGGQVQYKSDLIGGTYSGKMRWKICNTIGVET